MDKQLDEIIKLLKKIDEKLGQMENNHQCPECFAMVPNGAIRCFNCDRINP